MVLGLLTGTPRGETFLKQVDWGPVTREVSVDQQLERGVIEADAYNIFA